MTHGVGQLVLVALEDGVFVRVGQVGGQSGDLESQQPLLVPASVYRHRGWPVRRQFREPGPGRPQRLEVDPAVAVQGGPLGRRAQQLVVVLAVQVDDAGGHLAERGNHRRPSIEVGPGSPAGRHDTGEHDLLVIADDKPTVDTHLRRSRTHNRGVGAAPDEQLQGLYEHVLPARSPR